MSDLERSGRSDETGNILIRYNEAHVRFFFFIKIKADCDDTAGLSSISLFGVMWKFAFRGNSAGRTSKTSIKSSLKKQQLLPPI